jgi:hypothetical protein
MHASEIDTSQLDQGQVDYFLENAGLEAKAKGTAEKVLRR